MLKFISILLLTITSSYAGVSVIKKDANAVTVEDRRHFEWEIVLVYTLQVDCVKNQVILTDIRYESGKRILKQDSMQTAISDSTYLEKVCKV